MATWICDAWLTSVLSKCIKLHLAYDWIVLGTVCFFHVPNLTSIPIKDGIFCAVLVLEEALWLPGYVMPGLHLSYQNAQNYHHLAYDWIVLGTVWFFHILNLTSIPIKDGKFCAVLVLKEALWLPGSAMPGLHLSYQNAQNYYHLAYDWIVLGTVWFFHVLNLT